MTNEQLAEQLTDLINSKFNELDQKFIGKIDEQNQKIESLDQKFIGKFNELDQKFIGKIDNLRMEMLREFAKAERNLDEKIEINDRQHMEMINLIEKRFQESKNENENRKEETKTLYALSKLNQEEHKRYDTILNISKV